MRNVRVNRLICETGKIVMSVNRIKTIIETFLGSDMPGEVQQRFAEWLRDPASRGEKERALESYWNGLRAEEPGGRERKLERLHEAMRRGERFRVRRIWRNVAAAAAVVLLAAGTNYVVVKDYLRTKIETNIVTSAHDKGEYVLPDGTHIWLNAGSVLRYYGDLTGRRRVVELDGEGFFKVRHDADRPFTLSNPLVEGASKTISIFVYERGIKGNQFALSTAVGLFQSVVCVIFLLTLLVDALLWALTQWLMSSRLNLA